MQPFLTSKHYGGNQMIWTNLFACLSLQLERTCSSGCSSPGATCGLPEAGNSPLSPRGAGRSAQCFERSPAHKPASSESVTARERMNERMNLKMAPSGAVRPVSII